jgi:hypothetical protein
MGQPAFASQGPPLPPWAPISDPLVAVEPNQVLIPAGTIAITGTLGGPFGPFYVPAEQYKGMVLMLNVTAVSTSAITFQIQAGDIFGNFGNITGAVTGAISATGMIPILYMEPGAVEHLAVANGMTTVSFSLPDKFKIVIGGTSTGNFVYGLSVLYLK